jgi:hypothetical protein
MPAAVNTSSWVPGGLLHLTVPGTVSMGWGTLAYAAHRRGRPAIEANERPCEHLD